ncbi:MAG: hypothetical protein ACR2QW_04605 [bacterium]
MSEQGIKYFPGSNHGSFHRAFTDTPKSFHRFFRSWGETPNQAQIKAEIREYFLSHSEYIHLVSSEDICLLSEASLSSMHSFFARECGFSDVRIVCFLRDPLDYLNSSLQQYIKPGLVKLSELSNDSLLSYRFQGFPKLCGGSQSVLSDIYLPIPSKLVNVFGIDSVQFIKYEQVAGTSLVSSFVKTAVGKNLILKPVAEHTNQSLSHESCLLISEYNDKHPLISQDLVLNRNRVESNVVKRLRKIKGRPPILIDPTNINLELINKEIERINSLVRSQILTPFDGIPDKYLNNELLSISDDSIFSISELLDLKPLKLPIAAGHITVDQIREINSLFEAKFPNRWWNSLLG